MDLKLLSQILTSQNIRADVESENMIRINGIEILIQKDIATFASCKFRFRDIHSFISVLNAEDVFTISGSTKNLITRHYEIEHYKKIYELK